jgi:hypothetical protein
MKALVALLEASLVTRQEVTALETEMKKLPQVEIPVAHFFSKGLYVRAVSIPKGAVTVGKIHKHECISILAKGERSTLVNGKIVRVSAGFIQVTPPGFKRASFTHEDSVWVTAHATEERDIAKLEDELVCDTERDYQDFCRVIEAEAAECLS